MEIVGEDGSTVKLKDDGSDSKAVFGRDSGFNTKDRTVSRRHVLFQLRNTENQTEPRVSFQVVGKNPLWLRSGDGERKIEVFRKLDKGEMGAGDCFCISSQSPVWYNLKKTEVEKEKDLGNDNGSERLNGNSESLDISQIDPVKEFGFLIIGHEFDCYPNQRIRNPNNWDWFLEETKQDDDSDDEKKRKRGVRRKRKKDEDEDEDGEWSDESEDMETAAKIKRVGRPKYSTRSKDKNKGEERKTDHSRMKVDDDDDDTLGGFIVNDDDEEEGENDEEEEEELMEDEEEEELDE
ncbi:DEK domain-containing chromatin-associated protein 4 [Euphorbia lathyris]|uniref:DEK domain-containing chromatin-associated protein 4 n=1 Tax=Euphorbia lathyris TaxID=212925 RepID=UPI0033141236